MFLPLPLHLSRSAPAALLLATLLTVVSASAQAGPLYGAIAGGSNSNRWGISNNHATQAAADREAISSCNSSDCVVQFRFGGGQCGAIATTAIGLGSTGYGIGTKDEAFDNAIAYCTVGLALCSVDSWRCNQVQVAAPVAPPQQPYYAPPPPAPVQPRYAPIVAAHSGKCLDVPNGSIADNIGVNQYHCDGSNEQNFGLIPAGSGYYSIVAAHSGKCLDVPNGSFADNVQINQYHCDGSNEQRFSFRPSGVGYYNIVAAHSGKCLDVPNASTADNIGINQYQCDGSNEQRFRHVGIVSAAPAPPPPTYAPPQPAYAPPAPTYTAPPPSFAAPPSAAPGTDWTGKVTDPDGSVHRVRYDLNAVGQNGVRYIAMTNIDTGVRIDMYGFSAWPTSRAGVLHFQANPPGEPPASCTLNLLNSSHISYDGFCNVAGGQARVTMDGP